MIEIILDASQITTFEACPRKWYYDHILNLTPARTNPSLSTGTWFHEVLRTYYTNLQHKVPLTDSLKQAQSYAEELAIGTRRKEWPRVKKDPKFHLDRLRSYLINHLWEDEVSEILAVEKGFSYLLYEDSSRRYILEGMIDLISIEPRMGLTVTDHKTQQRYDSIYENNHQVFNYLNFTSANYFRYNYIGQQEVQNANTFHRPIFKPHPGQLEQWKKDVLRTFREMENFLVNPDLTVSSSREDNFPRRRTACDASKYGLCAFHKRCEVPDDSKWVPTVLTAYKEKEKQWRAWS